MTIATLLKDHGYNTGMVGKWHLGFIGGNDFDYSKPLRGGPVDHGFDYFFGMHASLDIPPYFYVENDLCVQPPTDSIEASHTDSYYPIQGAFWREGRIAPGFRHVEVLPTFTDKAIAFIRNHKSASSSPFFLYLAFTAPHTPWLPSDSFNHSSDAGMYGDFTVQVDHSVGLVLNELEQLGYEDNTLVFFTSDNGPVWYQRDIERFDHRSTYFLRGMKADAYEGGHRMPFIAKWPGHIRAGTATGELICFTDMLATFSDIVGFSLPEYYRKESASILPVLLDDDFTSPIKEEVLE
jgi:arylsulfatase A-like enzyme